MVFVKDRSSARAALRTIVHIISCGRFHREDTGRSKREEKVRLAIISDDLVGEITKIHDFFIHQICDLILQKSNKLVCIVNTFLFNALNVFILVICYWRVEVRLPIDFLFGEYVEFVSETSRHNAEIPIGSKSEFSRT